MLGLVAVIEGFMSLRADAWKEPLAVAWDAARQAARTEAPAVDILCFGDSQIHHALDPRVLGERQKMRAYSLAITSGQAASSCSLLRRALDSGARPRAVLVNFNTDQLGSPPRQVTRFWSEVLDPSEVLWLIWESCDPRFALDWLVSRALPTLRSREGIRETMVAGFRGEASFTQLQHQAIREQIHEHLGCVTLPHNPKDFSGAEQVIYGTGRRAERWSPHWVNALYVDRFLKLAAAHRLDVYWVLPPVTPAAQAWQERVGREHDVLLFLQSKQAAYPNVVVLDARHLGLDRWYFHDPTHLNVDGAALFSSAVADALAVDLASVNADRLSSRTAHRTIAASLSHDARTLAVAGGRSSITH
jgi:hypothetical protein